MLAFCDIVIFDFFYANEGREGDADDDDLLWRPPEVKADLRWRI